MKNLLKNAREKKEFTTRKLSEMLEIDQALINKYENGKRIPTKKHIPLLSNTLQIDENTLWIAWYKEKLLHSVDFNTQSVQAISEILHEKGLQVDSSNKKESQIASILDEIENLKTKLSKL